MKIILAYSRTSGSFFKIKTVVSKKKNPLFVLGRIEKSVPRDHRLSSLGKPRDAKRRSAGQTFRSYPHSHDRFLYYQAMIQAIVVAQKK